MDPRLLPRAPVLPEPKPSLSLRLMRLRDAGKEETESTVADP
jgi:hypothetical protein